MKIDRVAALLAFGSLALVTGCAWNNTGGMGGETSSAAPAMQPELSAGTVRQVQTNLKQDGIYQADIDGLWSPDTVRAVLTYQHRNNLYPSGHLDPVTLAALHVPPEANTAASPQPGQLMQPGQAAPPAVGSMPAPQGDVPYSPPAAGQMQTQ